jgi:hypothetical protein
MESNSRLGLDFKTVSHIRRRSRSGWSQIQDSVLISRRYLTSGGEAAAMELNSRLGLDFKTVSHIRREAATITA